MPSRRKKALRDSSLTHTFFNQTNGNVCTCGAEHNHNHATSSTNFAGLDANTEKFRHAMSSLWTERYNKLTTEERQRLNAAIAAQPTISDPYSVLRVLKDAHKLMNDLGTTPDEVPPMETFDLDNLEEVAETYDELCQKYKDEEEREMANLAGLISNSASIASDTTRSAEDRLAAELDMHNLNIHSKIIVPLTSCLRQAQLFNVEKKFGFPEEDYEALSNDDKKRRGEDVPVELPLSFRQTWNNPFKPLDPASKPSKKKGKKKLSGLEVLAELQCNCNRATEDMQNIGKTIRCAAESTELPSLAPSITYADVPVPEDIPDHVRQRFSDAEFAFQEVLVLQGEASKQLLNVRSAFVAWNSASREVWEAGKKRIHEMPLFREYEYTRISLHSMFSIASRSEVKIVEFYSSEGAPKLPLAMNEAFRLKSMSPEEFEKDWEVRCLKLHKAFPSVDKMMTGIENMSKEISEADDQKAEWWKWLVDDLVS